jgi:hypothetical protein
MINMTDYVVHRVSLTAVMITPQHDAGGRPKGGTTRRPDARDHRR